MKRYLHIDEIQPGMVLKAASANGTRTRRVHAIKRHGGYNAIWSIPVYWKDGDWNEECAMLSNDQGRISHLVEIIDGKVVETRIEIHG